MRDDDGTFGEYAHLMHMTDADKALHTLRKVASCVKPIMRKRGWRVGQLSEFFPDQKNLWGMNTNAGERINIRLRDPYNSKNFLDFNFVLDTMLHELSHNQCGPHDAKFYKLWDELREEWAMLQIKGFTGEGFLSKGKTLGGRRIPQEELRRRARAAALERAKENHKSHPGHVLGGAPVRGRDVRSAAAEAASKRAVNLQRSAVNTGCATGTKAGDKAADDAIKNGFRTKAEMDDANELAITQALAELYEQDELNIIEASSPQTEGLTWSPELGLQPARPSAPLTQSNSKYPSNVSRGQPPSGHSAPPTKVTAGPARSGSTSASSSTRNVRSGSSRSGQPAGTQINSHGRPVSRLILEAEAEAQRNKSSIRSTPASSSSAGVNWRGSVADEDWSCLTCTLTNQSNSHRCEACNTPRGAPPPPIPQHALNMDTPNGDHHCWCCDLCTSMNMGSSCSFCGASMPKA